MSLTWAQFNSQVRLHLHAYNEVASIQTLIDTMIPMGAADLQRTVEFYQSGHEEVLALADMTVEGYANVGDLPLGRIRGVRITKFEDGALAPNIFTVPCQVDWSQFPAMRGGEVSAVTPYIALNPINRRFAITPSLNDESRLVMAWDGVKTDFADGDTTPFDDKSAEAVGLFVLSKVTRVVDRDQEQASAFYKEYILLKRQMLSDTRWNAVVDNNESGQPNGEPEA